MATEDFEAELRPGILLIASAGLLEPTFSRTVILLCEHQQEGSFGLILNQLLPLRLSDGVDTLHGWDAPLGKGGPVQEGTLHFLHRVSGLDIGSREVLPGLFWGGDFDRLDELMRRGQLDTDDFRFFIGYSGWGKGQLADEIRRDSWYRAAASLDVVFAADQKNLWRRAVGELGTEFAMLRSFPDDPHLN